MSTLMRTALLGAFLLAGAGVVPAQTPVRPAVQGDTAISASLAERGGRSELSIDREAFAYSSDGRRDPFRSLMSSSELRPMISDLELKTVIYDPSGNSVAIMRDVSSNEQYRVRVGQTLGRMRVTRIQQRSVTFTIDEFGISRQETLALNDSTKERTQ